MRGKTGFNTRTVHGELYHFSKVDGDHEDIPEDAPIDKYGQMKLQFKLREPDKKQRVYIIDESSMLSSEPSDDSIAAFGSGVLLDDFFDAVGSNKIIFVGDPCQLPPVKQNQSPSLNMDWLAGRGRTAIAITLESIERTKIDNDIPVLAMRIRHMLTRDTWPKWPKIPAYNRNNVKLFPSRQALFDKYLEKYNLEGAYNNLAIVRSNAAAQSLNNVFRRELFKKDNLSLQLNEILLVNRNNYKGPTNQRRLYHNIEYW